jgi:hypothetical protein
VAAVHYDAFVFIETIRKRHWLGMLNGVDAGLASLDRYPAVHKRPGMFHPGSDAEFRRFLLATRTYLLDDGLLRPEGLANDQFMLLKPLCEHLVKEGRFAPDRLKLFAEPQPGEFVASAGAGSQPPQKDRA